MGPIDSDNETHQTFTFHETAKISINNINACMAIPADHAYETVVFLLNNHICRLSSERFHLQ